MSFHPTLVYEYEYEYSNAAGKSSYTWTDRLVALLRVLTFFDCPSSILKYQIGIRCDACHLPLQWIIK